MPLDLSAFTQTGFDPNLPGSGLMPGFANEIQKRQQLQIAQELQRRMAEEQIANQPNERANKDALTQQYLAQSRRYDRMTQDDQQMKYAEHIAKAKLADEQMNARKGVGVLDSLLQNADFDGHNERVKNALADPAFPSSARRFLEPDPKTSNYTKDALRAAREHLTGADPYAMAQRKVETQQQGAALRNEENIVSREREGAANRQNKLDLATMHAKFTSDMKATQAKPDQLAAIYMENARTATTPEDRKYWDTLSNNVSKWYAQRNPQGQGTGLDIAATSAPGAHGVVTKPNVATPQTPSAPQLDWIKRAKAANPNLSDEQIIAEGKRLGKL